MLMPSIFRDDLFNDFFDSFTMPTPRNYTFTAPTQALMKTDVVETENGYQIDIELPGYKKEDVKAELKDGYMTISASKNVNNDEKDKNGKYIRRERFSGNTSRTFYVGDTVTEEDIKARFEDGILKIEVPKKQPVPKVEEKKFITIEG